jgi:hypothetical protein
VAFPYLSENGFETGTLGHFDTKVDTETRLDFPHYSELARIPGASSPFRGAYCMRVKLENDGSPADAYVQETGSWDTAADGTAIYFRFAFYVSSNIVMANNDEFGIFQLWSSTNTVEGGAFINYTTANGLRIGIGETAATSFKPLTTGVWHQLELGFTLDNAGSNDGTIDAWLDGGAFTQVASLDQGAITSGVVGVVGQDAGTTTGFILFDEIVADDTRVYGIVDRFTSEINLTASGHVFVGDGCVENVSLKSGAGTDNVLTVYDTDTAYTNDPMNAKVELKNTANNELVDPAGTPIYTFRRGCYVALAGTNPRATVKVCRVQNYSDGAIRQLGQRRRPHPIMG